MVVASALAAFVFQTIAAASDARQVTLSISQPIVEIDTAKLKGEVAQLAWSPDGTELYLQTSERDPRGNIKSARHYVVSPATKTIKGVDLEPQWASKYWAWKAAQASPASPAFKIDVTSRQETVRATAAPTGGVLARGGTADPLQGTTAEDVFMATNQSQQAQIYTLKVRDQTIGDWVNEPVRPGVNFGWAPAPLHLLTYARREGGPLVVLDEAGNKQELTGARAAVLPAWSDNGSHIAWLERKDKRKYQLMLADVSTQ
ncbi:MAG TPA: hypothetical protein VGX46_09790 [Vicinamibacterales bacterium]|jgi:hypothetical protein|nr:hypothetical protein [Vicinamibacterales bacterium]